MYYCCEPETVCCPIIEYCCYPQIECCYRQEECFEKCKYIKIGILTQDEEILNLFKDECLGMYKYFVEDKNHFKIPLHNVKHCLRTGDIITDIPGKPGEWIVHTYEC